MADNQPTQVKNETGQPKLTRQQSARADSKAVQAKFVGRAKQKSRFAIQVASITTLLVFVLIVLLVMFENRGDQKNKSAIRPAVESDFYSLAPVVTIELKPGEETNPILRDRDRDWEVLEGSFYVVYIYPNGYEEAELITPETTIRFRKPGAIKLKFRGGPEGGRFTVSNLGTSLFIR